MKDGSKILKEAKELLKKGKIQEAMDLVKVVAVGVKASQCKCLSCGSHVDILCKDGLFTAKCLKCGAIFGKMV